MKYILFSAGLYFGVNLVIGITNTKDIILDVISKSLDSSIILNLALSLVFFGLSYKHKKV